MRNLPKRLVDYVAVIGLDEHFLNLLGEGKCEPFASPDDFFSREFKPEVRKRYPATNHADFEFPNLVSMFAFPTDARLLNAQSARATRREPSYHSFVMTELDGHRFYGFCVVKYSKISSRKLALLKEKIARDTKAASRDQEAPSPFTEDFFESLLEPVCLCIVSHRPYHTKFRTFFDAFLSCQEFSALFSSSSSSSSASSPSASSQLSSRKRDILSTMYSLLDVPFPRPGGVQITIGSRTVHFPLPKASESDESSSALPEVDIDFHILFKHLSPENIMAVFTALLNECQILLVSDFISRLTPCIEALCALLYPFEWQHVFIPVLPHALLDFFQAPMPYIIGVPRSAIEQYPLPENVFIIDIDHDLVSDLSLAEFDERDHPTCLTHRYAQRALKVLARVCRAHPSHATSEGEALSDFFQDRTVSRFSTLFRYHRSFSLAAARKPNQHLSISVSDSSSSSLSMQDLAISPSSSSSSAAQHSGSSSSASQSSTPAASRRTASGNSSFDAASSSSQSSAGASSISTGISDEMKMGYSSSSSDDSENSSDEKDVGWISSESEHELFRAAASPSASALPAASSSPPAASKPASLLPILSDRLLSKRAKATRAARRTFLSIFVSMLKTYRQFLTDPTAGSLSAPSGGDPNDAGEEFFDAEKFGADLPSDLEVFMNKFCQSQMFACFVQDRLTSTRDDMFDTLARDKMMRIGLKLVVLSTASKRGILWKQGQVVKNWKRRWFILLNLELAYFAEEVRETGEDKYNANAEKRAAQKGKLLLRPGETRIALCRAPIKGQPFKWAFDIITPSRTLHCCAESAESMREWVRTLRAQVMDSSDRDRLMNYYKPQLSIASLNNLYSAREEPMAKLGALYSRLLAGKDSSSNNVAASSSSSAAKRSQSVLGPLKSTPSPPGASAINGHEMPLSAASSSSSDDSDVDSSFF